MAILEISRRLGGGSEPANDLRAQAVAASAISCLNAATDAWTTDDGTTPLPVLVDEAMGTLSD